MKKIYVILLTVLIVSLIVSMTYADSLTREAAEKEVERIQKAIDEKGHHWTPALNPIVMEYGTDGLKQLCGYNPPENWREIWEAHLPETPMRLSDDRFATSFNWEDSGKVTSVKSQGGCGSCWDFAATGALEAMIFIYQQECMDLSEQQVLSCASFGWGCSGAWMDVAYEHWVNHGSILEPCMPYEADDMIPCTQDQCEVVATINGWTAIPSDMASLKTAVMTAPIAVAFDVYADFGYYGNGCYKHTTGELEAGHAVLLVGWDDNACGGAGAWRVKNSWSKMWGDSGYFWMEYDNNCNFGVGAALIDMNILDIIDEMELPQADTCNNYNHQMTATGGNPPYTWVFAYGGLPLGLVLDSDGLIHGTPENPGTTFFALEARDSSTPIPATYFEYFSIGVDSDCTSDFICGDVNEDEAVDILDILYLIEYKYKDGPAPGRMDAADVNSDSDVNLLDILCLVDYKYKDGPEPNCP